MRFIVRFLKAVGNFLDHRFPERMTADEVREILHYGNSKWQDNASEMMKRISTLEDQHNKMVAKITSLSLMSGVRSSMADRE